MEHLFTIMEFPKYFHKPCGEKNEGLIKLPAVRVNQSVSVEWSNYALKGEQKLLTLLTFLF